MGQKLEDIKGIGRTTAKRLNSVGIDSIEELAQTKIDNLLKINEIHKNSAKRYITSAKKMIKESNSSNIDNRISNIKNGTKFVHNFNESKNPDNFNLLKPKKKDKSPVKTWFPLEYMQQIRYYHNITKKLESNLEGSELDFDMEDLTQFVKYINLLNVNYKKQSQIKIFKELELTATFYDPIEQTEIKIWDIMFECARVLWVLAKLYEKCSKDYEDANDLDNCVVAMVECSKAFKTASYFSRACTRQEDLGTSLIPEELEFKSEEARIIAQSKAAMREENKRNFLYASKLYAGLSVLSQRLLYLRKYNQKKKYEIQAQFYYDMGKACSLKSKGLSSSNSYKIEEKKRTLQEKANFYFYQAEEIWENLVENTVDLKNEERQNLQINLSIVNENILENDVEIIDKEAALKIQDPEPIIIIPENIAYMIPRTVEYLTQYPAQTLEFKRYKNYKDFKRETDLRLSKIEKLNNKKAGIGRTIKELKTLYKNNDIDINKFTALLEKYSTKFNMIESAINKLENIYKSENTHKSSSKKQLYTSH
jgi:hypothetical protein